MFCVRGCPGGVDGPGWGEAVRAVLWEGGEGMNAQKGLRPLPRGLSPEIFHILVHFLINTQKIVTHMIATYSIFPGCMTQGCPVQLIPKQLPLWHHPIQHIHEIIIVMSV